MALSSGAASVRGGLRQGGRSVTLLRLFGALAWGLAAIPVLMDGVPGATRLLDARALLWGAAFLGFGAAFLRSCDLGATRGSLRLVPLALETLAALTLVALVPSPFSAAPLVVIADQLAGLDRPAFALAWIAAQSAALAGLVMRGSEPSRALTVALAYLVFQFFAHHTARAATKESRIAEELARTNAELEATQELLAESSRLAERARISGELHDVLGHHLTALSLNLEAAFHRSAGPGREEVAKAQAVARLLLGDVRHLASELREERGIRLRDALAVLVEHVPRPEIVASIPEELRVEEPAIAQALLRAVQETVTNAMRHSDAQRLWLELEPCRGGIELRARDDGRGAESLRLGAGLRGMRERLEAVGGELEIETRPGEGFRLRAWVPSGGPDTAPDTSPEPSSLRSPGPLAERAPERDLESG